MSLLLKAIKLDQLVARKFKNPVKSKLLTTLLGEASPSGNDVATDESVKAVISKFLKSNRITYSIKPNEVLQEEAKILASYLPNVLKSEDLYYYTYRTIEKTNATSMKDVGKVMKALRAAPYTIDMKEAQAIVKTLLTK